MTDRSLSSKAIDFKGGRYVEVHHRVKYFVDNFPEGSITTEMLHYTDDRVIFVAKVYPFPNTDRYFSGHAEEKFDQGYINKTSAIENCETSAVGRALGFMDIGVINSIASADEVVNAQSKQAKETARPGGTSAAQESTAKKEAVKIRDEMTPYVDAEETPKDLETKYKDWHNSYKKIRSNLPQNYQDKLESFFSVLSEKLK